MLKKIANTIITVDKNHLVTAEQALNSQAITDRFRTLTAEIKKISPRSQDFLYFVARGIHAMEHAAIDPVSRQYKPELGHVAVDNGHGKCATCESDLIKTASGEPAVGLWCTSSQVDPFINQNGDAFSELELLKEIPDPNSSGKTIQAYQTFVGKGLFTDHKSTEVENIRGIVLDAAYDYNTKGVDLLIALDKVAYPELARQITAGYSTDVSMGCQVNYSLCSICGNKAVTENDYCNHVRTAKGMARAGQRPCYEVNNGLNFIEISMVSNGADPRAKIKTVLASLNRLKKAQNQETQVNESENQLILDSINRIEQEVQDLEGQIEEPKPESIESNNADLLERMAKLEEQIKQIAKNTNGGNEMAQDSKQDKKAYMQGTVEPDLNNPFEMSDKNYKDYWEDDKHLHGQGMETGSEGMHPGYGLGSDENVKQMYLRANADQRRKIRAEWLKRLAYMQGTVEPDLNNPFEMSDKNYKDYWEDDKHLHGQGMETGSEGMHPGYGLGSDENVKKEMLRAKLRARLVKSANPKECQWQVFAGNEPVLSVTAEQAYGNELNQAADDLDTEKDITNFEWFTSKPYGVNLISAIKQLGLSKVASQIEQASKVHTAQAAPAPAAPAQTVPAPEQQAPAPEQAPAPGMEEGMDVPEGETEEHVEEQLTSAEAIRQAVDQIEEASTQIVSMVDQIEGEYGQEAAAEGEELATELTDVGGELDELGGEMGQATSPEATAALKGLMKTALQSAQGSLKKAATYVSKYAAHECAKCGKMDCGCGCEGDAEKCNCPGEKDSEKDSEASSVNKRRLEARKRLRHKIAQQLYNLTDGDAVADAHPEGGNESTFPQKPEGKVETETEAQKQDMEVANSTPRGELVANRKNIRKKLLSATKKMVKATDQNELDQAKQKLEKEKKEKQQAAESLVDTAEKMANENKQAATKKAEADNEAKQYYNELASQSATGTPADPETKKFFNELTQDFSQKKATAEAHSTKLRMKRAFSVAMKRAQLGQIENTQDALESDVDRLMLLSDEQFTNFADIIENTKKVSNVKTDKKQTRTAGALPVGRNQQETVAASPREAMVTDLSKLNWS